MQMQQLRYFLEIAREGSISAAAKNLYLSQPSLSQQIMKLEAELEVPLLVRHSKSVSLTDAGVQFEHHARRILGEVDQLAELMHKYSTLEAGTLKIGLLWIANYVGLLDMLKAYKDIHPNIEYELMVNGSSYLIELLAQRKLHAAFVISTEELLKKNPDFSYHMVRDDSYVAVVSRRNPLSKKKKISIEELAGEPLIMPAPKSALRKQLDDIFSEHNITPSILAENSQSDMVISLASAGLGVGISSRSIAETMQDGSFAVIPLDSSLHRSIFYVTLKELLDYPSIHSFTSYVRRYHV